MNMANKAEAVRIWSEIVKLDRHIAVLAKDCKSGPTKAYINAKRDMDKLKVEYEKANGTGSISPTSVAHQEQMTRNKVLGDRMGYTGPETTHGLDEGF